MTRIANGALAGGDEETVVSPPKLVAIPLLWFVWPWPFPAYLSFFRRRALATSARKRAPYAFGV